MQHETIFGTQPYGLPLGETTTPQYLKALGYTTRGVGKVSVHTCRELVVHRDSSLTKNVDCREFVMHREGRFAFTQGT